MYIDIEQLESLRNIFDIDNQTNFLRLNWLEKLRNLNYVTDYPLMLGYPSHHILRLYIQNNLFGNQLCGCFVSVDVLVYGKQSFLNDVDWSIDTQWFFFAVNAEALAKFDR